MRKTILALFMLPISLSAISIVAIFMAGAINNINPVFSYGSLVGFLVGIYIYLKLRAQEQHLSKINFLGMWGLMILSFFLLPSSYFINEHYKNNKNRALDIVWRQEHCKTVVTREHSYTIEFCEGYMPKSENSKAIDEYNKENPDRPFILGQDYDIGLINE